MKFEMMLTGIIFILLFIKIRGRYGNNFLLWLSQSLLLINFAAGFMGNSNGSLFGDSFYTNHLLAVEKNVLNLAVLIISLTGKEWLLRHKHLPEFFILLISSLLGLFFMLSSGNLLMFFLGLELSAIPLAALCNFDLDKKISGEAAMKLMMSSIFSSSVMLLGISFIYGACGTISFAEIPFTLIGTKLQLLGFVLFFTGFAFKLSIVPFHLWTADVYEGAPVEVSAFLSVVSKGAMSFVLITVLYKVFAPLAQTWYYTLAFSAAITMTVGNIFAIRQQNLKRFLAFSSVAQVGYVLIGILSASQAGVASVVYFILIYVFSNLAAFGVVSIVAVHTGKETITDYKGLYQSNPLLAVVLCLALFSLAGIPPAAGFFGKLFLLTTGAAMGHWWLIIIAALNMMVSLYYYLKVVRAMLADESSEPLPRIAVTGTVLAALVACVIGIIIIGFAGKTFDVLFNYAANL